MAYGFFTQLPSRTADTYGFTTEELLNRDGRTITGSFVDIRQQCGKSVRMWYGTNQRDFVKWVGINEQMADKFTA